MIRSVILWISVLFVFSILLSVEAGKDYYAILDVPKNAPLSQIKKHFKKLSRVYHPDKNPGDSSASEKFMEIAEGN
jgi:DnaJ-related protein SCJ1